MHKKILLASFQTWLPHQVSNSSDDLLAKITRKAFLSSSLTFLRQLPVDVSLASEKAIATIQVLRPHVVVCCGMAQSRERLRIESNAIWNNEQIYTSVKLERLISQLSSTHISHDAGKFVCEGLYYQILKYLRQFHPQSHCLFVHVPVINEANFTEILGDFRLILEQMQAIDRLP
ncbi:MAG: peptidase C15 [Hydrococcus sp. RU_2_2]|nr:peptidase C15 [Hydrococcus sp. RU_2_2]